MLPPARRQPVLQLITPLPGAGYTVRENKPTNWEFNWHHHPEMELTLIRSGSGVRYVGDSVEPFSPGDCILVGANVPHTWTSRPTPGRLHASVVIQFPSTLGLADMPEARVLRQLAERAARGLALRGAFARVIAESMQAICRCPEPLDRLGRMLSMLSAIAGADDKALRPLSTAALAAQPRDSRLAAVLAHIHEQAANGLGQREAAAVAGLSPAAFSRFFHRTTNKSFVAHLNEVRVGLACRALLDSEQAITAVAFAAGFQNVANFNRRFRHVTGMTPSAYRELARGMG